MFCVQPEKIEQILKLELMTETLFSHSLVQFATAARKFCDCTNKICQAIAASCYNSKRAFEKSISIIGVMHPDSETLTYSIVVCSAPSVCRISKSLRLFPHNLSTSLHAIKMPPLARTQTKSAFALESEPNKRQKVANFAKPACWSLAEF